MKIRFSDNTKKFLKSKYAYQLLTGELKLPATVIIDGKQITITRLTD